MRRVLVFKDREKPAHVKVNEWLANHPEVTLVDFKPFMLGTNFTAIFAIVEMPEMPETTVENKKVENKEKE